jgi:HAMP domain-containing protein
MVAYPFLGSFIDNAGKRAWLLLVTAGLLVGTHILLLIPFSIIPIPPIIPMLVFAMSLSIGTLAIVTSIPILTRHIPTGLGLHRSIDNIGATLFGTFAGMIQDYPIPEDETETESFFDKIYHFVFPTQEDSSRQEHDDAKLIGMFLGLGIFTVIVCGVFVWGDYHWTDGIGGKTRQLNSVQGSGRNNRVRPERTRRRRGMRRSIEILATMEEPLFDLEDELDADEVSMTHLDSESATFHSSASQGNGNNSRQEAAYETRASAAFERDRLRRSLAQDELSEDDYHSDEELHDERGEYRFRVEIKHGDDVIPQYKKLQAHFWIAVWTSLLLVSWVVFGLGMFK